jgi:uncharacterized protein with PIN domain
MERIPIQMLTPEKKLLKRIYESDLNGAVQQNRTVCRKCNKDINPFASDVDVEFRDIVVADKTYTLVDPYCPGCGALIHATYSVTH